MHKPYYTADTSSGTKVSTFLASHHGPGYVHVSDKLSLRELLLACPYSTLNVGSSAYGLWVDPKEFEAINSKTIVPGTGAWALGSKWFECRNTFGVAFSAYFRVDEDPRGGYFVTAYADIQTPDGPPRTVQLDVEYD